MYSRAPPLAPPAPWPGRCTLCVASNTTGAAQASRRRGNAPHVDDEIAVSKECAALGDRDLWLAVARRGGLRTFSTAPRMPSGCIHCPFLTLTGRARRAGCLQEISLAAEKRRDLQHIDDLGRDRALRWLMHVRQDAESRGVAHAIAAPRAPRRCRGPGAAAALERFALSKLAL